MKAIYQKPETELIAISAVRMLAGSNVEEGFNKDEVPTTEETEGNLARRHNNVWEDEEEEEKAY